MMRFCLVIILLKGSVLLADVKSTEGQIRFDTQIDGHAEMTLTETGLGIGTLPSEKLHVSGNVILSNQLFVGGSSGSSNLNVNGTIGYATKMISSNAMLGDDTMVLANSVSDNITLELPYAGNVSGRIYRIKRLSLYNQVWISGGGNVIDDTSPIELLNVNGLATIELMSNGTQWYKLAEESSSSTVATENLMGWWKMDESSGSLLLDSTDHGHDLTPAGSQTVSGGSTEGVMGRGQHFDNDTGAYSYTLANHNDFQLNRFSIMCWLKPERTFANMTSLYPAIFSKQNWVGNAGYYFGVFLGDTNNLGLRLMNGAGVGNRVEVTYLDSTFGIWFHVAATTDGTVLRIYKNGQLQSSVSAPATLNHDTQAMSIGAGYEGSLDDLRFYNKALSAAEIKVIYDGAR